MRSLLYVCIFSSLSVTYGCVKPKIYKAELAARSAAEAREKVLVKELIDRKAEAASLIRQVAELSKTVGSQEHEIDNLRIEISHRTELMGASSSKLANEKAELERQLAAKSDRLDTREALLQKIRVAQSNRKKAIEEMDSVLAQSYLPFVESGVTVAMESDGVVLTLPDKALFDANGVTIGNAGRNLLMPLAQFLANRPALDLDIVAYTDNILPPKEKALKDTWDWSLQRATNVARMLVREFNTNANQLTPVGRGEFYPITSNETAEGRQRNRRTVIVLHVPLQSMPVVD
jgi:chemotaxis protein MotB